MPCLHLIAAAMGHQLPPQHKKTVTQATCNIGAPVEVDFAGRSVLVARLAAPLNVWHAAVVVAGGVAPAVAAAAHPALAAAADVPVLRAWRARWCRQHAMRVPLQLRMRAALARVLEFNLKHMYIQLYLLPSICLTTVHTRLLATSHVEVHKARAPSTQRQTPFFCEYGKYD
jgi:hypothetical protein